VADINAIATAMANRIATTGVKALPYAPGAIVPPAVVVIPDRPAILYGQTMDGEVNLNFLAIVVLSAANDTTGQLNLNNFVASSGAQSVNAAIQGDPSLAGTVEFAIVLQVGTYGLIEYAGQQYIGASFLIQCGAHL
jgi:hypothetical protein